MKKLITITAAAAAVALPVAANATAGFNGFNGVNGAQVPPVVQAQVPQTERVRLQFIGGRGNGPLYTGLVKVVGRDVFRLNTDHDGWGCE